MSERDDNGAPVSIPIADDRVGTASDQLTRVGYTVLDRVLPDDLVGLLRTEFLSGYRRYLDERETEDALTVGNRRFMVTVELSGSFGDPRLYANPVVMSVVRDALGPDFILENFGVVVSLPGALAQPQHRDGSPLFGEALGGLIPAYALTVAFPLIEMNDTNGTTALWPGSHRYRAETEHAAPDKPVVRQGSCALWDYRLLHGGTPNISNIMRPLVYGTYSRKWWRDADNFKSNKQDRLKLPKGFLAAVPDEYAHLFAHLT